MKIDRNLLFKSCRRPKDSRLKDVQRWMSSRLPGYIVQRARIWLLKSRNSSRDSYWRREGISLVLTQYSRMVCELAAPFLRIPSYAAKWKASKSFLIAKKIASTELFKAIFSYLSLLVALLFCWILNGYWMGTRWSLLTIIYQCFEQYMNVYERKLICLARTK